MVNKLVQKDWDNFKALKEFVEAEKLSKQLQDKIHAFHESFLISKSYTIDELVNIPGLNWLRVTKYLRWKDSDKGGYHYWNKGEYEISLVPFVIRTKRIKRRVYSSIFMPDDFEKSFFELLVNTVIFKDTTTQEPILKTLEDAETLCQKYNDLLRDKILAYVVYQKQEEQRFILNNNNNPISIHTDGCSFDIDVVANQLIIGTSSIGTEELNINGHGDMAILNYWSTQVYERMKLVFDISTNNLLTIKQED